MSFFMSKWKQQLYYIIITIIILSVMTAVTFPLRPPRLAFAICGWRWQNDLHENKVGAYLCFAMSTENKRKTGFNSLLLLLSCKIKVILFWGARTVSQPLTLKLPDQVCYSPYCQPYSSPHVCSENLVLDQLITAK